MKKVIAIRLVTKVVSARPELPRAFVNAHAFTG